MLSCVCKYASWVIASDTAHIAAVLCGALIVCSAITEVPINIHHVYCNVCSCTPSYAVYVRQTRSQSPRVPVSPKSQTGVAAAAPSVVAGALASDCLVDSDNPDGFVPVMLPAGLTGG